MRFYDPVEPPRPARLSLVAVAALCVILALAVVANVVVARPVTITVDGRPVAVAYGTTPRDLASSGALASTAGDLVAVDGSVLREGAGEPATVFRSGRPVRPAQRLYRGDVLTSSPGENRVEATETTLVPIPFEVIVKGSGPLAQVTNEGAEGERRVTRGVESGIELTSTVVRLPADEVVTRVKAKPGAKLVALTFDDGPWPESTERILDILAEHDVRATFFVLGPRVKKSPETVRRMVREGHVVGAHSVSHKRFDSLPPKRVRSEVRRGRAIIREATGVDSPWLRPPYGAMDKTAWKAVRAERAKVVLWDVDSRDWKKPGAKKLARRVVADVRPGSVVLLHDGGGDRRQTVAALPRIITELKKRGYLFITVEDLQR